MNVVVRVIRTFEVPVEANYGDTERDLIERGVASVAPDADYAETAVVLYPEGVEPVPSPPPAPEPEPTPEPDPEV